MFRKALIAAASLATAFAAVATIDVASASASAWYAGFVESDAPASHMFVPHCWRQPVYGIDVSGSGSVVGYRRVCE